MFENFVKDLDPMRFVDNLKYMGIGMLGIFVVIGLIVIATCVLNYASGARNKKDK